MSLFWNFSKGLYPNTRLAVWNGSLISLKINQVTDQVLQGSKNSFWILILAKTETWLSYITGHCYVASVFSIKSHYLERKIRSQSTIKLSSFSKDHTVTPSIILYLSVPLYSILVHSIKRSISLLIQNHGKKSHYVVVSWLLWHTRSNLHLFLNFLCCKCVFCKVLHTFAFAEVNFIIAITNSNDKIFTWHRYFDYSPHV